MVIAVIAILAATLSPVFARAREAARGTQCKSNLKQMGSALMMHRDDYDGHVNWRRPSTFRDSDFRVPGSPPATALPLPP